jgi:putative intracellular protease/amidase
VLAQISNPKFWVSDDFARVEFIISEDALKERGFAGSIATDEADFIVSSQGTFSTVEKNLIAVAFMRVSDL